MSELASWIRHLNATKNDDPSCRYCWRPLFDHNGRWDLVYREYDNTLACDARGDGTVLSTLPHEPAPYYAATIGKLIEIAAQVISEPGSYRDTDEAWDAGLIRLITEAAGLTVDDENYVYAAILRVGCETRGKEFRDATYKAHFTEPPASWQFRRPRSRVLPIRDTKDADKRMQAWALAGRPNHQFSGTRHEQLCRICAGGPDGIQHLKPQHVCGETGYTTAANCPACQMDQRR